MIKVSEAGRRGFHLLLLLVAVLTGAMGTAPLVDRSPAYSLATPFPLLVAVPEASLDSRLGPAGEQRDNGNDGPPGDLLTSHLLSDATAGYRRAVALHSPTAAPISEHAAAYHQARAPPAA